MPVPTPRDPAAEARATEQALRRAEKLLEGEPTPAQHWEAIQALEGSIPLLEGKLKQRGRILLARAKMKNPNWVRDAGNLLKEVLSEEPKNVDARFILATIYRDTGFKSLADKEFRKVLELRADHEEARAALAELGGTQVEPEPEKRAGLLKKLFKKS